MNKNKTMEVKVQAAEILKRPYARVLTPDTDGSVTAEIMEFPNCVAFGSSATEALANLEEVAAEWIAAALEQGQEIPEPMSSTDYSGKTVLRMTRGLHKRAALCADREGVSLNQFINTCLAEAVGERAKPAAFSVRGQLLATASLNVSVIGTGDTGLNIISALLGTGSALLNSTGVTSDQVLAFPTQNERGRQHA